MMRWSLYYIKYIVKEGIQHAISIIIRMIKDMSSKHLQSVSVQKIGLILNLHSDNDDAKCCMFNNF